MYDVLKNLENDTIKCLDKGYVTLVDVMPRLVPEDTKTADFAIVQAARVSYGQGTKTVNEDRGLIRFLMRMNHSSPLEMIECKWRMKLPIFVARQIIRHRTSSVNEVSGRYSILEDDFFVPNPEDLRKQSLSNKQGGDEVIEGNIGKDFAQYITDLCDKSYARYEQAIKDGVSREQARMFLPVNLYTSWYWKVDLHNLLHFLGLRCDSHAQYETRVYGNAMLSLIRPIAPIAIEAWEDYNVYRGAVKFTRLELDALKKMLNNGEVPRIDSENKREQSEWLEKMSKLRA